MAPAQCAAIGPSKTHWSFCPNVFANYLFAALFGCIMLIRTVQAVHHKRPDCWVIIVSASCQIGAYVIRGLSIQLPINQWVFIAWNVLLMVFTICFGLITMALRINAKINLLSNWHISTCFILLDIRAFAIQASGSVITTQPHASIQTALQGIRVYMAGIGIQQCFIPLFSFILYKLYQAPKNRDGKGVTQHRIWLLYVVLALISIRIVFRIIEYSRGVDSDISRQEFYMYSLEKKKRPRWVQPLHSIC
ncbi:hypothetical protein K505DRAFT_382270 [Melanomma pulvis-pyrius CBS 109.77]|uniref:RTA1 like protein n=1 Tax=Melanomma pulvis-pyrius CBS 109.77 TaxID=1314802 RepID=A0A6A6XVQ2_9PLEO|nr:hypothetical protein K505DRAFT_382270 [Melanomma pulvis-pyrius CBS 109.77]